MTYLSRLDHDAIYDDYTATKGRNKSFKHFCDNRNYSLDEYRALTKYFRRNKKSLTLYGREKREEDRAANMTVGVPMPRGTHARLKARAEKQDCTVQELLRRLINRELGVET